MTNIIGIVN